MVEFAANIALRWAAATAAGLAVIDGFAVFVAVFVATASAAAAAAALFAGSRMDGLRRRRWGGGALADIASDSMVVGHKEWALLGDVRWAALPGTHGGAVGCMRLGGSGGGTV